MPDKLYVSFFLGVLSPVLVLREMWGVNRLLREGVSFFSASLLR